MESPAVITALLLTTVLAGCKKPPGAAPPVDAGSGAESGLVAAESPLAKPVGTDLGKKYSCPDDRVAVKTRSDVDPMQALGKGASAALGTPSDEIKADPERYAKWKADREADMASSRARYAEYTVFEVTGCGHTEMLTCRRS
jgi:hypothetical protein